MTEKSNNNKSKIKFKIPIPYELKVLKSAIKKVEKKTKIKIPLPYDLKKFFGHTDNTGNLNLVVKKKIIFDKD